MSHAAAESAERTVRGVRRTEQTNGGRGTRMAGQFDSSADLLHISFTTVRSITPFGRLVMLLLSVILLGSAHCKEQNHLDNEVLRREPHTFELSGSFEDSQSGSTNPSQDLLESQDVFRLCLPHGQNIFGSEGVTPAGMVLEKVHALLVSPPQIRSYVPFADYPVPPLPCDASRLSHHTPTGKSLLFHQTVETFTKMRKSKSGMHHFNMIPDSDICREEDVPLFSLLEMMRMGEFFAERYGPVLMPYISAKSSQKMPGKDLKLARILPGQSYLQSAAAFSHGLLPEKQFMRVNFQKMPRNIARELNAPCWCRNICDVEHFMQEAYRNEHDIFKDRETVFSEQQRLYEQLGITKFQSAKELIQSLTPWLCELKNIPCKSEKYSESTAFSARHQGRRAENAMLTGQCANITERHISQLFQAIGKHNQYLSTNDLFISYAAADTHNYFQEIFTRFRANTSDFPFSVHVVDDYLLIKVLSVLGISVQDHIFPGSRLVIEQYRKVTAKGAARFWKILLNGKVVTDDVALCENESWNGLCAADIVKMHVSDLTKLTKFGVCDFSKDEL